MCVHARTRIRSAKNKGMSKLLPTSSVLSSCTFSQSLFLIPRVLPQGPHPKAGLKSGAEPCSVEFGELNLACTPACENRPWSSTRHPGGSEGPAFLAPADEQSHPLGSSTLVNQPLRKEVRVGTRCFKTWPSQTPCP